MPRVEINVEIYGWFTFASTKVILNICYIECKEKLSLLTIFRAGGERGSFLVDHITPSILKPKNFIIASLMWVHHCPSVA